MCTWRRHLQQSKRQYRGKKGIAALSGRLSQHTTSKGAMCNSIIHLEVRVLVLEDLLAEVDCAKSSGLRPDQGSTIRQPAANA